MNSVMMPHGCVHWFVVVVPVLCNCWPIYVVCSELLQWILGTSLPELLSDQSWRVEVLLKSSLQDVKLTQTQDQSYSWCHCDEYACVRRPSVTSYM